MEKSKNSEDADRFKIVVDEIAKFKKLIRGHRKLLEAIGNL